MLQNSIHMYHTQWYQHWMYCVSFGPLVKSCQSNFWQTRLIAWLFYVSWNKHKHCTLGFLTPLSFRTYLNNFALLFSKVWVTPEPLWWYWTLLLHEDMLMQHSYNRRLCLASTKCNNLFTVKISFILQPIYCSPVAQLNHLRKTECTDY